MGKKAYRFRMLLLSVSFLIGLVLSGCSAGSNGSGKESGNAAGERTIRVLYLGDEFWVNQVAEFEQATGIDVEYETLPFPQLHDAMTTAFVGGSSEYDVIHVRDDWVAEFAPKGFLAPLDDLITEEMKSRFGDKSFKALSYDGQTYGVPRYFWAWQFYYNKDMLAKAGVTEPPATWKELIEVSAKLKAKGIPAFAEPWGQTFSYTPFIVHLRAEGGQFWDTEKGVPAFNSPQGVAALTLMRDLNLKYGAAVPGSMEYNDTASLTNAFAQGNFAMTMSTPNTFSTVNNPELSKVVDQVGVALIPGSAAGTASYAETGGLAIPASSKKQQDAFEFIKFVTSKEQEVKMALGYGSIPADPTAAADPSVKEKYPHFSLIPEQLKNDYGIFVHENATVISSTVSKHITAAVQGKETPEQALADAEREVLALIGK